jgi:hypothetical protein
MKEYQVTITETLQMTVEVEAESSVQAEQIVHRKYHNSDYILDADHFKGVQFSVKPVQKNRDYER